MLSGIPDQRDSVSSEDERRSDRVIIVSRGRYRLSEAELTQLAFEQSRTAAFQVGLVLVAAVPFLWRLKSGLASK